MKLSYRSLFLIGSVCLASSAFALTPPKYLSVEDWESCVGTVQQGGATLYCMPKKRPSDCPKLSWRQLRELGELQWCPRSEENPGSAAPLGSAAPNQ